MKHLLLLLALLQQDFKDELPRLKPTEPADAIKTFKLQPGYRIELVAAEPLVSSPVDCAFDEEGRLGQITCSWRIPGGTGGQLLRTSVIAVTTGSATTEDRRWWIAKP